MSHSVTLLEAARHLAEIVASLGPDDEVVLTQDERPIARIVSTLRLPKARVAGSCKGMLVVHEDDDDHLKDFGEYQP